MSVVEVQAERPYPVIIAPDAADRLPEFFGDAQRVAVVQTQSVSPLARHIAQLITDSGRLLTELIVPDGEDAKQPTVAANCWSQLALMGFTRSDLIIGLGGGAVTDLAGFIAACWLRGIDFVSIPTTVLGMVDAAVGGKTGVNLPEGKNLVGAFHEPRAVLADSAVLSTLSPREVSSGLAEIVKAGFIDDPRILDLIRQDPAAVRDPASSQLTQLITWGIEFKARIVAGDLRERTSTAGHIGRELLNYGHTLGHAIERFEDFQLRHGEAIAIGMVYAAELSHRIAGLPADDVQTHRELLAELGLPTSYQRADFAQLRALMARDKKTRGDALRFIGLAGMQQPVLIEAPDDAILHDAYRGLGR